MFYRIYKFPTLETDGRVAVEKKYLELKATHRNGKLSNEELDWMDWAEGILRKAKRA